MTSAGIYVASKAKHYDMWRTYRRCGLPIISTWIDEGEVGATTDFADLWSRCIIEAASAAAVILYCEEGEILKGALVEIGAAMASGKPVFAVGPIDGTFYNHPLFVSCANMGQAVELAMAAAKAQAMPAVSDLMTAMLSGATFSAVTSAEAERLFMLMEESAEVIKAAAKIGRHGYRSRNPDRPEDGDNRHQLRRELADVQAVVLLMDDAGDVERPTRAEIDPAAVRKLRYTHHQPVKRAPTESEAQP